MMFNRERKAQFLKEKMERATISNNINDMFTLAEPFEKDYGRDLCEWNSDEIITFYKYYSTPNIQTLIIIHNYLSMYTNWCISNGMVSDNQNHYEEINSLMLCKCVNLNALRKNLFTKEELMSSISEIPNYADRFLMLGAFEGIPIKDNCMYNVKLSDIQDGNRLILCNGSSIIISNDLKHIINVAVEETSRYSLTANQKAYEYEYTDGDRVIRNIKRNCTRANNTVIIGKRLHTCGDYLGMPSLTFKALSESGRMWYISEIANNKSITVEDAIIKHRSKHEKRYGKIQNAITYLNTYGVLIRDMYGCE